jgi:hypothetical protein
MIIHIMTIASTTRDIQVQQLPTTGSALALSPDSMRGFLLFMHDTCICLVCEIIAKKLLCWQVSKLKSTQENSQVKK